MLEDFTGGAQAEQPFLEINENGKEGGGTASLIFVISIILVILLTGFFVFYKYWGNSQVANKQQALNSTLDQLHSTDNKTVETKAQSVNSAIKIITTASKSKYSFKGFIDELTKKITSDTKLNSLAVSDAGLVTFDGVSGSYRSVADLALSLQSSAKLENVQISGLTETTAVGKNQVSFSMTAQIKDWKVASSATTGGAN